MRDNFAHKEQSLGCLYSKRKLHVHITNEIHLENVWENHTTGNSSWVEKVGQGPWRIRRHREHILFEEKLCSPRIAAQQQFRNRSGTVGLNIPSRWGSLLHGKVSLWRLLYFCVRNAPKLTGLISLQSINRDCWYLYTLNPLRRLEDTEPDQTIEILMQDLNSDVMSMFSKDAASDAQDAIMVHFKNSFYHFN